MRIRGWLGRADQTAKINDILVYPKQLAEIARRHPELGRVRLIVRGNGGQDITTLEAEAAQQDMALAARVAATLGQVTKLTGNVKLVAPGALPNDGIIIADERNRDR
jgi:phenylacetate-CoA ligase